MLKALIGFSLVLLAIQYYVAAQKHDQRHLKQTKPVAAQPEESSYVCSMHPEIILDEPGACPKCGMALVKTARPEASEFNLQISTIPRFVKVGQPFKLSLEIQHPKSGKRVKEFHIVHDMPFHLFVVSQDLESFAHIHPTQQPDGTFTIKTTVTRAGAYLIYCDIFPKGGLPQVLRGNLLTAGFSGDLFSSRASLTTDTVLNRTTSGIRFELTLTPHIPVAGKKVTLNYKLVDEKTGEAIRDLEPYLGAFGHTLILSEDTKDYVHSHPTKLIVDGADRTQLRGGPEVSFDAFVPRPGRYRIWSQFQRDGKVITIQSTIEAKPY
jgi:hypothetical protein